MRRKGIKRGKESDSDSVRDSNLDMNKLNPVSQSSSPVQRSSPQSSPEIRYDLHIYQGIIIAGETESSMERYVCVGGACIPLYPYLSMNEATWPHHS